MLAQSFGLLRATTSANFSPEGVFGVAAAILNDAALDSANIVASGQVSWHDISIESRSQPVPVNELVGRIMETYGAMGHAEGHSGE